MAEELVEPTGPAEPVSTADAAPAAGRMTTIGRTLSSVLDVGRELLARRRNARPAPPSSPEALADLCRELLDHRGEASGLALASEVVQGYKALAEGERMAFFEILAVGFDVDSQAIFDAVDAYREEGSLENLWSVNRAVEAPRQKLFRRINVAPEGTATLVRMRGHLLPVLGANPQLRGVDSDLRHRFISWFTQGFLELRRIDWSSPAAVLEKIIDYESVHEIHGW